MLVLHLLYKYHHQYCPLGKYLELGKRLLGLHFLRVPHGFP